MKFSVDITVNDSKVKLSPKCQILTGKIAKDYTKGMT